MSRWRGWHNGRDPRDPAYECATCPACGEDIPDGECEACEITYDEPDGDEIEGFPDL